MVVTREPHDTVAIAGSQLDLKNNEPTNDQNAIEKKRSVNKEAVRFAVKNGGNGELSVTCATKARERAKLWINNNLAGIILSFGLPEIDDRFEAWRVALLNLSGNSVGELVIRCHDGEVVQATKPELIKIRLFGTDTKKKESSGLYEFIETKIGESSVVCGDSRKVLSVLPENFFSLVVTSPPYFNARPQYSEYADYEEYLALLKDVFSQCHRTLDEGRFLILNASPVLVRRPSRNKSSKRIPVPFHINGILEEIGFEFVDDIIWAKPAGAGWNTGRGRRFAADRNPLQYKPVPITEYFLIYRKFTDKLIDWNIRSHNQKAVKASKIQDGYEVTNIWYSKPAHHSIHPAVFPVDLIEKLISYYSFQGDTILDPFAGIGTVGHAACNTKRQFYLIEIDRKYCSKAIEELTRKCQ